MHEASRSDRLIPQGFTPLAMKLLEWSEFLRMGW
jgi:hypothetical protein